MDFLAHPCPLFPILKAGELVKQEEEADLESNAVVDNPDLLTVYKELRQHYADGLDDGFCSYLFAVALRKLSGSQVGQAAENVSMPFSSRPVSTDHSLLEQSAHEADAPVDAAAPNLAVEESDAFQRAILVRSIHAYPWNWSAWTELTKTIKDGVMLNRIHPILPDHIIKPFWFAQANLDLQRDETALELHLKLNSQYPNNKYIKTQLAIIYHNLREVDTSIELFEAVRKVDPFKIGAMDIFSNVLYIKDDRAHLRYLAHHAMEVDKFTPETCCILGNFHSLCGFHDKAIVSYLRALKLDPNYLDAWTLVGHEYMAIKDPHHAIAAYRRAVDANPTAYRAWYGLGQAYELLVMHQYAIYYYERAAELRPHDARMWCAMGVCYQVMGQLESALRAYHRAEANEDKEGDILHLLAELYRQLGRNREAATYYTRNVNLQERDAAHPQQIITALHFLAHYYKDIGDFEQSFQYCSRLVDFNGPEKEEIRALMRDMSAAKASRSLPAP